MLQLLLTALAVLALSRAIALRRWPWLLATLAFVIALGATLPSSVHAQKVVGKLVMPLGLMWLGLCLLSLIAWQRGDKRHARVLTGITLVFWLLGSRPLGGLLIRQLQSGFEIMPIERYPKMDALLVLGGGAGVVYFDRAQLTSSGDRVAMAARLYHLGKAPLLVTTGMSIPGIGKKQAHLGDLTGKIWRQLGVPKAAILDIPAGYNTSTEMSVYARLIRERGWGKVGLVTSGYHMKRSLASARNLGLKLIPIVSDIRGVDRGTPAIELIPQKNGFWESETAMWEFIGRLVRS